MARDPNNIIKPEFSDISDIKIDDVPDFRFADFDSNNPKEVGRFIYRIERICRNSFEYRSFIRFLKEYGNLNECSFFQHVACNGEGEGRDIRIEIHHEPITLYDIASTIFNKRLRNNESIHDNMVAKEIMYNHYKLHCGLIPLSETVHEMVHNQFLFIPSDAVLGKWQEFIKEYSDYIPIDVLSNINSILEHSKNYDFKEETKILESKFVSINVENPEYKEDTETLYNFIKTKLDDIENKEK